MPSSSSSFYSSRVDDTANYYMDELEAPSLYDDNNDGRGSERDGVLTVVVGGAAKPTVWSIDDLDLDLPGDGNDDRDGFLTSDHGVKGSHRFGCCGRRRGVRWVLVAAVGVVLIIGLSAAIVSLVRKSQEQSPQPSSSALSLASVVPLPKPSEKLGSYCNSAFVSENGYDKCQKLCEPASCCYIPSDLAGTCQDADRQVDCQVYQVQCSVLAQPHSTTSSNSQEQQALPDDDGVTDDPDYLDRHVQPAPDNLAELCDNSQLETIDGMRACAKQCIQAHCCYDGNGDGQGDAPGCGSIQQPNCPGYQPCFNLKHKLAGGGRFLL